MNVENQKVYKYSYWLDNVHLARLKTEMKEKKIEMICAQYSPCESLKGDIGYAEPDVWPVICAPDATPWYAESRFNGKNLVVSSTKLCAPFTPFLETTIIPVNFTPDYMPTLKEKKELSESREYLACEPSGWRDFPEEWSDEMAKGFARMAGDQSITFEDIRCRWAAVHANFKNPTYRANDQFLSAPYSIDEYRYISTCCVELFNLLDSNEKALLVRPCIGAVIAEALEDKYYCVIIEKNNKG